MNSNATDNVDGAANSVESKSEYNFSQRNFSRFLQKRIFFV